MGDSHTITISQVKYWEIINENEKLRTALGYLFVDWQTLVSQDLNDGNDDVRKVWATVRKALGET